MTSSWRWIWDFADKSSDENDTARLRLVSIYQQSIRLNHDFPDEKFALHVAGRDLARHLNEPWWEMFYRYWMVNVLVFDKRQPQIALDYAVPAVFDCSKPAFRDFPFRIGLQMSLAAAYRDIDPIGYEVELRALFEFVAANCDQYLEDRPYYLQLWSQFLLLIEDPGAVDAAFTYFQSAEMTGNDHDIWESLVILCEVIYRFDRTDARLHLGEFAALGEEAARREERNSGIAEFLMWRAVASRWAGDETEAKRCYRRAMTLQAKLPAPKNAALYPAMAFHEAGGELEMTLRISRADIRILHAHQLSFLEAQRRLEKCRLLKLLGRDFSREAKRLRRVAAKLKSQGHWEAKLAALEASPRSE